MVGEIIIGTVSVGIALGLVASPVFAFKLNKENKEMSEALDKHNIVYCVECETYKIGKSSLCTSCITNFAEEIKTEAPLLIEAKTFRERTDTTNTDVILPSKVYTKKKYRFKEA